MQMFNAEQLQEKWAPLLDYDGAEAIKDSHRRMVTAVLLENQEKFMSEERAFLSEGPTNAANACLLYTSPSPRDATLSRMPSSA